MPRECRDPVIFNECRKLSVSTDWIIKYCIYIYIYIYIRKNFQGKVGMLTVYIYFQSYYKMLKLFARAARLRERYIERERERGRREDEIKR